MKRTRLTLSAALREEGPMAVIEEIVAASPGTSTYTHPATHPPSIIAQDASNRFVTDTEKNAWNAAEQNVQSDWNVVDTGSDAFIKNKPAVAVASDLAYGSGWDNNTDCPTKNAVYDKIETLSSSGLTHAQVMSRISLSF